MKAKSSRGLIANQRGQGLVESMIVSTAIIGFVSVLLATCYFSAVHVGMSYLLHEGLMCEATEGSRDCRSDFLRKSRAFLFSAKLTKFTMRSSGGTHRGLVEIEMPLKRTIKLEKELSIYQ